MVKKEHFERRYEEGNIPWEINRPDRNLIEIVSSIPIKAGKCLDIGCGTGDNTIWLSRQGFEVIGCDVSRLAVDSAVDKASVAGVTCSFVNCDFLQDEIEGAPFSFLFDRGCFHSFSDPAKQQAFAHRAADLLEQKGIWLSLIGNSDEVRREEQKGPPQHTALEIVKAVEVYFEILMLRSGYFDSNRKPSPRNWICLNQKRERLSVGC
ncbi:MAG: class I SAM-dependent methyltransferase [Desulfobia sp.]